LERVWGLGLGILASPLPAGKYGVERHVLMLTLQTRMLCTAASPASPGLSPPGSIQLPLRTFKIFKTCIKISVCLHGTGWGSKGLLTNGFLRLITWRRVTIKDYNTADNNDKQCQQVKHNLHLE